jgi:hypothetical protein
MKRFLIVLIIVLPLLALAMVKTLKAGHFRNNALKWASPSLDKTNLVIPGQWQRLKQPVLFVNLDRNTDTLRNSLQMTQIDPENLLAHENLKKLRAQKGSIVLVSEDPALSSRVWMLLSQMGYSNLFVLTDSTDNEVFKYKFRPDTSIGPEL